MTDEKTLQKIKSELLNGKKSQAEGNEGRARVCARRAAGWAIQEFLLQNGEPIPSTIALELIKYFAALEDHPEQVYQTLERLTIRVAKDSFEEEAYYPIAGVDLVKEANWLIQELLGVNLLSE
ncbi:MAG: hypothetical protein JW757_00765 [Anaerolineales bacterium]|nr:hypothetical protein [Anaerolineales bacterium]